jgi:hypothetical protein
MQHFGAIWPTSSHFQPHPEAKQPEYADDVTADDAVGFKIDTCAFR